MTKSSAAVPSLQISVNFAGAMFSNPCHLQVQEFNVPVEVLVARLLVMTAAKMVVNRVAKRQRKDTIDERMLSLRSFPGWISNVSRVHLTMHKD